MKKFYLIIAFFFLTLSCQFDKTKIPTEKQLFDQRMKEINWTKVDKFPSISECEHLNNDMEQNQCFFEFLNNTISNRLDLFEIKKYCATNDTLPIKISVFANSKLKFESNFQPEIQDNKLKLDSILKADLSNFPKITPAIKHGLLVTTVFTVKISL